MIIYISVSKSASNSLKLSSVCARHLPQQILVHKIRDVQYTVHFPVGYLAIYILFFVSVRKCIRLLVVKQWMIPIAPRKSLGSTAQMIVWDKLGSRFIMMGFLIGHGVDVADQHSGDCHSKRQDLPQTHSSVMLSGLGCCCRKSSKRRWLCN